MTRTISTAALIAALSGCGDSGLFGAIGGPAAGRVACPEDTWRTGANSSEPIGSLAWSLDDIGLAMAGPWTGVIPGRVDVDGDELIANSHVMPEPYFTVTVAWEADPSGNGPDICMLRAEADFASGGIASDLYRVDADPPLSLSCPLESCGETVTAEVLYPRAALVAPEPSSVPNSAPFLGHRYTHGTDNHAEGSFYLLHSEGGETWEEHLDDWVATR